MFSLLVLHAGIAPINYSDNDYQSYSHYNYFLRHNMRYTQMVTIYPIPDILKLTPYLYYLLIDITSFRINRSLIHVSKPSSLQYPHITKSDTKFDRNCNNKNSTDHNITSVCLTSCRNTRV